MIRTPSGRCGGFSLVELLVVIGVLGVLIGLLLPAVQGARATAAKADCQNRLRQVAIATHHHADGTGSLPPYVLIGDTVGNRSVIYTWGLLLTPYLGHQSVRTAAEDALRRAPAYAAPPHDGLATVIKEYVCPSDGRLTSPITDSQGFTVAYGSYVGIAGDRQTTSGPANGRLFGAMMPPPGANRGVRWSEISDGTSQTIMFGECPPPGRLLAGSWYSNDLPPSLSVTNPWRFGTWIWARETSNTCRGPFRFSFGRLDNLCDSFHLWSLHPGGANFAFCDGSVRFLSYSADSILPALATRAGGEVVEVP